jgi:hypothetical protein
MAHPPPQPFRPPALQSLPSAGASLAEVIRFIGTFELPLIDHYRQRWGAEYPDRAQSLWARCVDAFQAGRPATGAVDDLLLCLGYDSALGPYLGVPESDKLRFWVWLIDGVRRGLVDQADEGDSA